MRDHNIQELLYYKDFEWPSCLPTRVLKKCRFYTFIFLNLHPTPSIFQQSIPNLANNKNMTYKSTTCKPKINADSTLLKHLNLQPTFNGPPPPEQVCRYGARTLFGENPQTDLVRPFHETCLHKFLC